MRKLRHVSFIKHWKFLGQGFYIVKSKKINFEQLGNNGKDKTSLSDIIHFRSLDINGDEKLLSSFCFFLFKSDVTL